MGIEDSSLFMRYLLGDLPDSERETLEEQYFANDEVWEALNAAEHELIDMYVRGSLSCLQREQFESYFLDSPRKRQQLEFARTLLSGELRAAVAADSGKTRGTVFGQLIALLQKDWRPGLRIALAAGALAVTALALFLAVQNKKLRDEFNALKSGSGNTQKIVFSPTPTPSNSVQHTPDDMNARIVPSNSAVISVLLTSGMVRDGSGSMQIKRVMLSEAAETVELRLALDEDAYPRYDAVIRTAEGQEIQHTEGLQSRVTKNSGHIVLLKVTARCLSKGDYIVRLSGRNTQGNSEEADSYAFSVIR